MKKRFLSSLLVLVMVLSMLPVTALAEDLPAIADRYVVNGVTYYNAKSSHFQDSSPLFIQDLLTADIRTDAYPNNHTSVATEWQYLASFIQEDYGKGTSNSAFKKVLDEVVSYGLSINDYGYLEEGYSKDDLKREGNTYNIRSSKLTHASSMAAAAEAMEKAIYEEGYKGAGGSRKADEAVAQNEALWADVDTDDVYWVVTGAYKTGSNPKGHYQALGVLFSDFAITTILPEDNGNFYQSSDSEPTAGSTTYASHVKNMTDASVSAQQEISNTTSTTATSTISGSKSYGYEEGLEVGVEADFFFGSVSTNISFSASQTIESGWSEDKSCSEEQTTTYNVSVELPPYTNVMMKQNTSEAKTTTVYNCPVALSFTVTVVEYTLDPSSDKATCETQVLATFGANARKDLKQRAVIESSLTDRDGINWGSLFANHKPGTFLSDTMEKLTTTAPMSSAGATFTVVDKAVTSEISGLAPILALSKVKTTKNIMEYNLTSGEYLYVDTIGLEGQNRQNAPYYGFDSDNGRWILVDEAGKELTGSPVAKLETSSVTGHTKLVAGDTDGTVYLKYLIDEDVYATAENPTVCTTNADLDSTAVIEVHVSGKQFDGSIDISGTLTGIVGDPAKPIESSDGLTASVKDATGKEISRPVVWDRQELESRGIKVEDNQISFTEEGTFHVRAIIETGGKTVYSDWYEVTALPARKLSVVQIPDTAAFDYKYQKTLDLAGLTVSYKDQYGADWTDIPALTWTCNDEGVTISDAGVLTVPSAGVYTVTASAGETTSNTLTITVTDSSPRVTSLTPATTSLSASGGSVEFTITGENLTDGITIQADASITAATTGTPTEQKATLVFPANTDTSDKTYTVTNNLDSTVTAAVTVAKKSTGGGGGGGGGGAALTETVTIRDSVNGKVTADNKTASKGNTVTLTVTPDKGYTLETLTVTDGSGKEVKLTAKDGKYTFTMPASNVAVKATFMEDNSMLNFFVDVPADAYYYDAVLWAAEKGITGGVDATHFAPYASCTRAQAVTFLWRAAGCPAPKSSTNPFTDVKAGSFCYDAVLWAVEQGITNGTGDGTTFSPNAACNRAQIVAFLWRSEKMPAADTANSFTDVASDAYYVDAVNWAVENGITEGTGDGTTFSPDSNCNRAQIVTFLYRCMK